MYNTSEVVTDPLAKTCVVVSWKDRDWHIIKSDWPAFAYMWINGHWRGITYECFTSLMAAEDFCDWWNNKTNEDDFEGTPAQYCRECHRANSLAAAAFLIAGDQS